MTVVMPRRDYPTLCGNGSCTTARAGKIERALGRYAHIDVADIPYYVRGVPEPIDARAEDVLEPV